VAESELDLAAEKFEESKELAETAMINLLENEVCFCSMLRIFLQWFSEMVSVAERRSDENRCLQAYLKPRTHAPETGAMKSAP